MVHRHAVAGRLVVVWEGVSPIHDHLRGSARVEATVGAPVGRRAPSHSGCPPNAHTYTLCTPHAPVPRVAVTV